MYRKIGKKVIFEIDYKDIISTKNGWFNTFLIFCDGPITKVNAKKGPRTLIGHYSDKDIYKIEKIIQAYKNSPITAN